MTRYEVFTLTPEQEAVRKPAFDKLGAAMRAVFGLPDDWQVCGWDARHYEKYNAVEVEGGVPRPGVAHHTAKWRGVPTLKATISREQIAAAVAVFEATTGRCARCSGNGYEWAGSSASGPTRYRTCAACKGTGVAAHPTPDAAGLPRTHPY